jgi:hypothetical protein
MAELSLEPSGESRVLSKAGANGRVVAFPINEGKGLCLVRTMDNESEGRRSCWPEFPETGILASWEYGDAVKAYGVAADDVTGVVLKLKSGASVDVPVVNNLFKWESADLSTSIVSIDSIRDGVVFSTPVGDPRG